MARLILVTAEGQRAIELRPTNSIGRHPSNTIQLLDRIVSKEHCVVEQRADGFWLRDLGSLNGTYINAERVNGEQPLKHRDEIVMGSTRAWYDDGRGLPASELPAYQAPTREDVLPPSPGSAPIPASPQAYAPPPSAPLRHAVPSAPVPAPMPAPVLPGPAMGVSPRAVGTMAIPAFGAEGRQLESLGRIDVMDEKRAIGTQIAATDKGFRPFEMLAGDPAQLRADYERLRLSHELSREIALEHDTTKLLGKILQSIFKFVRADRGVIFLKSDDGKLEPGASLRRDGSATPIVVSSTILNHVENERAAVLTHDAAMDFAASKGKSMILNRISSAIVVPLLHNDNFLGVLWLDSESLAQFQTKDLEIVTGVGAQAAMFIENNALAKKIERELVTRERFSRLLSPNVAERVISGELEVKKGGELVQECTVFNSDIRGFTRMSAKEQPEVIVEMLNEYFELMVETLFKYEGTLDKFMGDGLMALWGAPIVHPDDAVRAVDCALAQMQILGQFNREREQRKLPQLGVGIGIHTGPLVAGYIGSSRALSYTVIGDTVNTSARLCSHAKTGQILVSQTTHDRLGGRFEYEELEPAKVKGKEMPLAVFNVLRRSPAVQVPRAVAKS
jgi:adenylate cyclase